MPDTHAIGSPRPASRHDARDGRRPRAAWARLVLAAAFAVVLPGCSALTTMLSTPGGPHPERPIRVAGTDLFDWKGVIHCHSFLSHDSEGEVAEIADAARVAAVDFVVMTDHQTDASIRDGKRGMVGDTLFMVGAEVRSPQGTVLAFPLTAPLRRWQHAALLVAEATAQGALSFVCHAELWKKRWDVAGLTGAEIVNLHAGVMTAGKVGTLATVLLLPLRSLFERICVRDDQVFAEWDRQLAQRHPFTPIGGNDAHANVHVFGPLGGTIGTYREVFLTLSTHVLAPRLDEASIVEALRQGRSYVAFDVFGEGAGFDFRAVDAHGGIHLAGDTVPAGTDLELRVSTPESGRIALLRDGAVVDEQEGDALSLRNPPPGIYRVEVRRPFGSPWLFSGTIRVVGADR